MMIDLFKKLTGYFLILLLMINSAGYTLIYFQLRYFFREEAINKIENFLNENELTCIMISYDDIRNSDNGYYRINDEEFLYQGKLYDVVEASYKQEGISILCFEDILETKLEEHFKDYLSKNLSDKTSLVSSLLAQLISEGRLPTKFIIRSPHQNFIYNQKQVQKNISTFIKIPSPPPKYFS